MLRAPPTRPARPARTTLCSAEEPPSTPIIREATDTCSHVAETIGTHSRDNGYAACLHMSSAMGETAYQPIICTQHPCSQPGSPLTVVIVLVLF